MIRSPNTRWKRRNWLRFRDFGFRKQSLWIWGGWSCLARWQGDYFCFWSSGRRAPGSWSSLSSSSEGKDRARWLGPIHCQRTVHKGKRKPRRDFVAKQEFTFHTAATQVNKRPQGRDILQEIPWNFSRTSNSMKRQGQLQIIQQPSPSSNQFLAPHVWKQNSLQKPDGDGASLDFSISLSGWIN